MFQIGKSYVCIDSEPSSLGFIVYLTSGRKYLIINCYTEDDGETFVETEDDNGHLVNVRGKRFKL